MTTERAVLRTEYGWWHPGACIDRHDDDHNCLDEGGSIIGWREPSACIDPDALATPDEPVAGGLRTRGLMPNAAETHSTELDRLAPVATPDEPVSPYRDAGEHERQTLAGTHLFDSGCYWCLLDFWEQATHDDDARWAGVEDGLP